MRLLFHPGAQENKKKEKKLKCEGVSCKGESKTASVEQGDASEAVCSHRAQLSSSNIFPSEGKSEAEEVGGKEQKLKKLVQGSREFRGKNRPYPCVCSNHTRTRGERMVGG